MGKDDFHKVPEVEKSINAWRQSERKIMVDTIQDLIRPRTSTRSLSILLKRSEPGGRSLLWSVNPV